MKNGFCKGRNSISIIHHLRLNCINKVLLITAALFVALLSGCAPGMNQPKDDIGRSQYEEMLSREAYEKIEPLLLKLKPGDSLDATGLEWPVHEMMQGNQLIGLIVQSDGWIGALSGGIPGAFYKFGAYTGRSGDTLYGEHVFGYLIGNMTLVPKCVVRTQTTIILQNEYKELQEKKTPGIGWSWTPGMKDTKTFFKDLKVAEVRPLNLKMPDDQALQIGDKPITVASYKEKYLSPQAFQLIKNKLDALQKGTGTIETVASLGGVITTRDPGEFVVLFGINGFLNTSDTYRWSTMTPQGVFMVWGFGYLDDGKEIPKLALIFKNGKLLKVVDYTSREDIEKEFSK